MIYIFLYIVILNKFQTIALSLNIKLFIILNILLAQKRNALQL